MKKLALYIAYLFITITFIALFLFLVNPQYRNETKIFAFDKSINCYLIISLIILLILLIVTLVFNHLCNKRLKVDSKNKLDKAKAIMSKKIEHFILTTDINILKNNLVPTNETKTNYIIGQRQLTFDFIGKNNNVMIISLDNEVIRIDLLDNK